MTLPELKALSERFRACADDLTALDALADETLAAHPGDPRVAALCARFQEAADGDAVRQIADETAARTY